MIPESNRVPPPVPGRGIKREYLLLQNFVENDRRQRAKVLRNQQLENYYLHEDEEMESINNKPKYPTKIVFEANSFIEEAIINGNKYEVLNMVNDGLSLSYQNSHGMTLLHLACMYDDYIIAQALLKAGASCNVQDYNGWSPLHVCAVWDSLKCAQLLVSNDANLILMDSDGNFSIDLASYHGHLRSMLLKHIENKHKMDEAGLRSLQMSGFKRMAKDVKHLLEHNKEIDRPVQNGMTLLHIATCCGYLSVMKALLDNNVNVNAVDNDHWTPLHCAAKYNQVKAVKILLAYYANPHSKTVFGYTPADLASNSEIRSKLLEAEESFLDLSQQRTPAKTKRFSASLLDQNEDIETQNSIIKNRIMKRTTLAKCDVKREHEIVARRLDELRGVLNEEKMQSISSPPPPSTINNYPPPKMVYSTYEEPLPPPPSTEEMTFLNMETRDSSAYVKAVIICQRAVRNFLARMRMQRSLTFCGQQIPSYGLKSSGFHTMSTENNENEGIHTTISAPISKEDRRYSTGLHYFNKPWTDYSASGGRPLSTGALPVAQGQDALKEQQPVWVPLKNDSVQRSSSQTLKIHEPQEKVMLTNTVKRSLTMTTKIKQHQQPYQHPKYATVKLRRTPSQSENATNGSSNYHMPPLTSTVATMINLAADQTQDTDSTKMPPPLHPPPVARTTIPHSPQYKSPVPGIDSSAMPHISPSVAHDMTSMPHRKSTTPRKYGTLLSNRANILRDSRLKQSVLNHSGKPSEYRHSWSHEKMTAAQNFSSAMSHNYELPEAIDERKRFSDSFDGKSTDAMISQLHQLNVRHHRNTQATAKNNSLSSSSEFIKDSENPLHPQCDDLGSITNKTPKSKGQRLNIVLSNSPMDDSELPEVPPPLQLYSDLPSPRRFLGNDNRPPTFSTFLSKE